MAGIGRALGFIGHPDGQEMAARLLSRSYSGERIDHLPTRGFTNQIAMILAPVALGSAPPCCHALPSMPFPIRKSSASPAGGEGAEVVDTLWLIHRAEWLLSAPAAWAVEVLDRSLNGFSEGLGAA